MLMMMPLKGALPVRRRRICFSFMVPSLLMVVMVPMGCRVNVYVGWSVWVERGGLGEYLS